MPFFEVMFGAVTQPCEYGHGAIRSNLACGSWSPAVRMPQINPFLGHLIMFAS